MLEQTPKRLPKSIDRALNATPEEQAMFPELTAQQVIQINNVSGVAFDAINKNIDLFKSVDNTERASVLDLGAGNGRNAQVLAKAGLNVIAVENNSESIKNLEKKQKELLDIEGAGELTIIESDFSALDWGNLEVDHAIAINALRFARQKRFLGMFSLRQTDVLAAMQEATRPGGINIVSDLTTNGPLYTQWHDKHESWFSAQALFDRYSNQNWDMLSQEVKRVPTKEADHHGKPLWNQSATVVAKKNIRVVEG